MNFFDKEEYSLQDVENLIQDGVEEDIHLEFKSADALVNKREITKDISAFANADGGVMIYGIKEEAVSCSEGRSIKYKATKLDPIDRRNFSKETLEQVISNIRRRIPNVKITPIPIKKESFEVIYVVKIPRSNYAPHMAQDNKYYKRQNFQVLPMEEYEVRDCLFRQMNPSLKIQSYDFHVINEKNGSCFFSCSIYNDSNVIGQVYKLNAIFHCKYTKFNLQHSLGNKLSYTRFDEDAFKISMSANEPIFPNETIELGHFELSTNRKVFATFIDNVIIELTLFYQGGKDRILTSPIKQDIIRDEDVIEETLRNLKRDIHNER